MAKPKLTLKGAAKQSLKGGGAVRSGGILLTVLALVDAPDQPETADGSTGCQLQVTAFQLQGRSGPGTSYDILETLPEGAVVDGTAEVKEFYRRLEGDRWAPDEFLAPVAGTTC